MEEVTKKKPKLTANFFFSFVSQMVVYVSLIIGAPHVSRALGADGVGEYSLANSYVYYFSSLAAFGFSSLGIQFVAANRDDKEKYSSYFWTIFFIRLLFVGVMAVAYVGVLLSTHFGGRVDTRIGLALLLVLLFNMLDNKFLFQGLENFKIISIFNIVIHSTYIACIFLFVKSPSDVLIYTILRSSLDLALCIVLWLCSFKYLSKPTFLKNQVGKIILESFGFFLPSILESVGGQLDQTIIGGFCTNSEVGYYQQASKFPAMISSLTYSIAPVMLSRVSYLYSESKHEEIKNKIAKAICLTFLISIPACCGMFAIGRYFIPLYFGKEFLPSVDIMYVLLIAYFISPINSLLIHSYYYPTLKIKKASFFLAIALGVNVGSTLLFVGALKMGAIGAALGTVMADFVLLVLLTVSARQALDFKFVGKDLWKIALGGAGIIGLLFLINHFMNLATIWIVIIDVLCGVVIFAVFELLLRELIIKEFLGKVFNKNRQSTK